MSDVIRRASDFVDVEGLLSLLSKQPLGSASVNSVPLEARLAPDVSIGPLGSLALNLRGNLSLQALNGPEDQDEAEIAGPGEAPLRLTSDGPVWLRYAVTAGLKAEGSGGLGALGLKLEGDAAAELLDYRRHQRNEPLIDAVRNDIRRCPRWVFSLDDVLDLAGSEGDAVALRLEGRLEASATATWSDVFSTHLTDLVAGTAGRTPVAVSLKTAASLTASVSLADAFRVVFTGLSEGRIGVVVKKARRSGLGVVGQLGATASIERPEDVAAAANAYLSALVGAPFERVQGILEQAEGDALSPDAREVVQRVLSRLGLPDIPGQVAALRQRLSDLRERAETLVKAAAKAKLEAAFTYEYRRIRTDAVLFQGVLSRDALRRHHRELVAGRLAGTLEDPAVQVEEYLNEKGRGRTASWGLALSIGKWRIAGKDTRALRSVDRIDRGGHVQRAYLGSRAYDAKWIGRDWSWQVDFAADMPGFSAAPGKPQLSEFEYAFSLVWNQSGTLDEDDVVELADMACLWSILDEAHLGLPAAALHAYRGRPYQAAVQLIVGKGVFRAIHGALAEPGEAGEAAMAGALAAAMPYWKELRELTPDQRGAAYQPLWALYLANPQLTVADLHRIAPEHLRKQPGLFALGNLEALYLGHRPYTFVGLAELNEDTPKSFHRFTRGCRALREGILSGAHDEPARLPRIYDDLRPAGTQSHHVRALGRYLLAAAARQGVLQDVRRSLTVLPEGEDAVVFASA